MAKLKVGIVGVGGIAQTHMPGWHATEDAEVVAGSDVRDEALQSWGREHGVDRLYSDPADLFDDSEIDIVDVCTPNSYHAPLAIAALNAAERGAERLARHEDNPSQGHVHENRRCGGFPAGAE